jgi:HlyD family secretion protein
VQQQGLVSFEVTVEVLDPDEEVKPGLTAAVQIVFRQVEDALLIPNRAVRWVQGEQVVYVAQDENRITESDMEMIPVSLGASSDQFSELLEGDVSLGDLIILNPPSISIFEEAEAGQGPPAAFR